MQVNAFPWIHINGKLSGWSKDGTIAPWKSGVAIRNQDSE